ncbi:hypothetical protein FKM82_015097 [Ascaphus truei]
MASLARLLCEAVENEDAKEVENLLKRGADANLVLPTGIAAIHLAAGKESESALRCLTLLLQQGGNPNVRSIEELTPVHVAASWGCYKTLVFLLRKGGDPGLQDQEGNRASDLALEEGNRRCVVALQEYSERVSDGAWPDQSRGNCRNDSSLPDNITQLSSISHLLESSSICSPFSSTRNSPLTPLLRNEHPGKCMDDAVTSQVNLQGFDATRDLKVKQRPAESRNVSTVLHPSVNPETTLDDSCDFSLTNSMVLSSKQLSHTSHRITDTSGHLEMHVIGADSLPLNTMIEQPNTSMNAHSLMSSMHDLKRHSRRGDGPLNKTREAKNAMGLCRNERDSTVINSPSKSNGEVTLDITAVSRLLISQSVTGRLEGLDVTSPDHVYMYSREAAASDDDWEKTLVIPHQNGDDNSEEQVLSSSSKYNSCESECYASLGESSHSNEKRERSLEGSISDDFCHQSGEDKGTASQIQPYRTLKGQRSALRAVETLPKKEADMQRIEHLEQGGAFTQRLFQLNGHEEGMSRECVAPSQSQDRLFHHESNNINLLPRVSETLCSSESPTLSVGVTGVDNYGSCNHILKDQLRHLMLSTKGCRTNLPVGENQPLPGSSRSATVSVSDTQDTLPVMEIIGQTKYVRQQDQEFTEQLKAMMVLTKLQVSPIHSNATLDTLVIEPAPQAVGEKEDVNLSGELKRMMMSTKAFQSPLDSMDRPCFFTPRTKSRLRSSNSRHNSSSSLFDDTLDMPKRVRRIRSPDGLPQSPHTQNMVDKSRRSLFPISTETKQTKNSDITLSLEESEEHNLPLEDSRITSALTSGSRPASATVLVEPETTVNISNFFTDDLSSSDTDRSKSGPCFHHKSAGHCVESQVSGNTWLTEDGEEESSGEASHKDLVTGSSVPLGKPHSVLLGNGSLLHSTLLEDPVGKGMNATRAPRYSFSRLSCVRSVERPPNPCQLSTIHDSGTKDVPLSPGGRPVNVSQTEPMEYLYIDPEKGHALIERHVPCTDESATDVTVSSDDTIIYDWRDCKREQQKGNQPAQAPPNRVAVELYRLSNDDIARRLKELGEDPGPVTSLTRKVYISLLDKRLKEPRTRETNTTAGYSPELSLTLRTFQIPDCHTEELTLSQEFDQPDKTRKWREGVLKSSFNYLLLDPRVTRNLPSRCHTLSQSDCFRTFVSSIFYVGKGKRSRPYCHLYEALTHHKTGSKQLCSKVQHILDIWSSGLGVISLHCFQNTIPVEAYTREACIVDGIGLKMLTNQKKGVYYGQALSWSPARRRRLGVHMLHRALQIFLAEGERQLRPADIRTGQ